MKIILSRKGFDSGYGKIPSPIMPDGTLLSLPIPSKHEVIQFEQLYYKDKSYADIISELKNKRYSNKKCHLDPDIRKDIIARSDKWKPAFGQENASLTHLFNQGVGINDLFLFFGWFRKVEEVNGKYQYVKGSSDKHIIYGYLQVGKILRFPTKEQYSWLDSHPHLDRNSTNNAIFVAKETLSWNENLNGADCLKYKPELVLTKDGFSRSRWNLPDFFKDAEISYHSKKSWRENYFQSASKGQEFVINSGQKNKIENWAKDLIND